MLRTVETLVPRRALEMDQSMDDIQHYMPGIDLPDFGISLPDQDVQIHNFTSMPFQDASARLPNPASIETTSSLDPPPSSRAPTIPLQKTSARSRDDLHQLKLQHLHQLQQMQSQLVNTQMEILKLTQSIHVADKNDDFLSSSATSYSNGLPTPSESS